MKLKLKNKMEHSSNMMDKFLKKIIHPQNIDPKVAKDLCFGWEKPFDSWGRPVFRLEGHYTQARKILYESENGQLEDDQTILSTCYNTKCMNPNHLFASYYFKETVNGRNDARDSRDGRKRLKVTIVEKHILDVFKQIQNNHLRNIPKIGQYMNVDDEFVIEFLQNNKWRFLNQHYSAEELDQLRLKVGITPIK